MSEVKYNLVVRGDEKNITVVVDGNLYVADENHPAFDAIVKAAVVDDDPSVVDLFDASVKVVKEFEKVTDRVSSKGGNLYFDRDVIDDVYADEVLAFLEQGISDWEPLVKFLELALTNNDAHTRENLSRWLKATGGFEIDAEGYIIGYKGVNQNLTSIRSGPGIVNGVETNGNLDNSVGNVVEMARSQVEHDPSVGCATGLHVGTWEYARGFGHTVLKVRVNPQHVVSVPTDCSDQKIRCSRYEVLEVVNGKTDAAYVPAEDFTDDEDDEDYGYYTDDEYGDYDY